MPLLWALLASLSFWTSSQPLDAWLSLEPSFTRAETPAAADVLVCEDPPQKTPSQALVLLSNAQDNETKGASLRYVGPPGHPLAALDWNGAPQLARWKTLTRAPDEVVYVETQSGAPFLLMSPQRVRLALVLHDENRQFQVWPALPYVLYASVELAAQQTPARFAEWSVAPLPTLDVRAPIYAILLSLLVLSLLLFAVARRASKHATYSPEVLAAISGSAAAPDDPWARVSFRRPLAGFLFYLTLQVLLLISLGYVTDILAANTIQPFPWVDGTALWVTTTFEVIWYLFDCGTRDAFIRFFAERRHANPQGALQCAQFFVWWQLLTGILQITLITFLALEYFPDSSYALYAWPLLLQAAGQWPGVQNIFSAYFQGAQRFDYAQLLDSVIGLAIGLVFPIGFVLYFRAWGAAHPAYGEAMGALLGLAVGSYATQLTSMLFGAWLARRAKLPVRALFYVSFDRETAKEMLRYGALLTIGQLPNRLSFAVNNFILKARLLNYSELSGIYGKANGTFLKYFKWPYSFYASGVPVLAEAFGAKKPQLIRYYLARFAQYGVLFSAIIFALVLAAGEPFVRLALDPQWARISDYLFLLSLIGVLLGPSWLSDTLQQGAGKPGVFGLLVAGEQLARIGLFLIFVEPFGFRGYLFAILVPLLVKIVIAWAYNVKKIIRPVFSLWVHALAPALVGVVLWLLLFAGSFVVSSALGASVLLFGGGLFAILGGFFLGGLFGIFDKTSIDEMHDAARMTGRVFAPLVKALPVGARLGYRLSPLKEKHALPMTQEALQEAEDLTRRTSASE